MARAGVEHDVWSYFAAFAPAPDWDELVRWPPDVFALASLVLDHTESYRCVVAPPPGRCWPPLDEWSEQVREAARDWRDASATPEGALPALVRRSWSTVTQFRHVPLSKVRSGEAWELISALLTLHATADEACADIASSAVPDGRSLEGRAARLLESRGSLSRISPARVRIVPKTNFSARGITIRSLSRYVALCYESVDIRWRSCEPGRSPERRDYNILLVPWPLAVKAEDFRPAPRALLENMDLDLFGFFEFAPEPSLDCELVASLLEAAVDGTTGVDAVIFPEAAVHAGAVEELERTLADYGASLLVAGAREPPAVGAHGRNYLHLAVRTGSGWDRYQQDKHHRWLLDEDQIRQYHLSRSLDRRKLWWEAIDIGKRTMHIVDIGRRLTAAPLVCEDLASLDEVADLVRRAGPSLVVAVLLDGPQLASRWPGRYASLLADDPGSAVLTLTAYGMAARCRPRGRRLSRVVAHWNSRLDGPREVELARRAEAVLLTTSVESSTSWTADGRRHEGVPRLTLSGIHQLRAGSGKTGRRGPRGRPRHPLESPTR